MNNFPATSIDDRHLAEFNASAISEDITELNFRSWNPSNENDLDYVFTELVSEPEHRNNGTLAGRANEQLANTLRSGGWLFEGHKGVSVKPNSPRTDSEGKVIKYESPRGAGNQQIFIPCVSVRVGNIIATKIGQDAANEYAKRTELIAPEFEDTGFWEWFIDTDFPLIITEGAKKAASLVSAGYAAIALNGVWGWGNNLKDMFGEVEKGDRGETLKTLHPDLEPFLNGREIVLAFDRDDHPHTVKKVESAKTRFRQEIGDDAVRVTQLKWRNPEGTGAAILLEFKTVRNQVRKLSISRSDLAGDGVAILSYLMGCGYYYNRKNKADLLEYLHGLGADFHLMGDTSTGKTTAVKVAVSVTGEKEIPNWRTTANGLEMTATAHNHSMLPLDEIGQADEKGVGEACYMLRNGQGKSRSTKDLKARKVKTWRLLFLSTGEHSLTSYMAQAGKVQKGGQEVGMPDIPAVPFGSPYGVFESIHGCDSSKEFAENLEAACQKYRGTAIDEFLARLVVDRLNKSFDGATAARVFQLAKKLAEGTIDLAVSRVANRFALVQVALEIAHSYSILPFPVDRIEWAIKKMFTDWLIQRGGDGSTALVARFAFEIKQAIASNIY